MLVRPVPPLHRHRRRRAWDQRPFTCRSDLGATILRMISTHSLPAFTPAVGRNAPAQPLREAAAPLAAAHAVKVSAPAAQQRPLDAVPAPPARPVPRGSLLDLRV